MQMNKLKVVIEKYPDIWEYDHLFRAVLMDIYPEEKLIRNLLRVSVEERIPHQLKEMNQYSFVKRFELSKSMVEAYGCSKEMADLIVDLWIEAFGLRSNNRLTNDAIARHSIEELDLSASAYNSLKRAGVNIVADVMRPRKEEPMFGRSTFNFSKRAYDELVRKIKELDGKMRMNFIMKKIILVEKNVTNFERSEKRLRMQITLHLNLQYAIIEGLA